MYYKEFAPSKTCTMSHVSQDIVEIVCDTAGQRAQHLHLFGTVQPFLQFLHFLATSAHDR